MSTKAMVAGDRNQLRTCEKTIERGMATFVDVGKALAKIKEKKLYRDTNKNFEEYCRKRWDRGRDWADLTIRSAEVVEKLPTIVGKKTPAPNFEQARKLAKVPAEKQPEVWAEATKDGNPTGKKVAEAAAKVAPAPEKKKRPPKNGEPMISTTSRKAIKAALGSLIRALDDSGILGDFEKPIEEISKKVETL